MDLVTLALAKGYTDKSRTHWTDPAYNIQWDGVIGDKHCVQGSQSTVPKMVKVSDLLPTVEALQNAKYLESSKTEYKGVTNVSTTNDGAITNYGQCTVFVVREPRQYTYWTFTEAGTYFALDNDGTYVSDLRVEEIHHLVPTKYLPEIPYFDMYYKMGAAAIPTNGEEFNKYSLDLTEIVEALKRGPVALDVRFTSVDGVGFTDIRTIIVQGHVRYNYAQAYGVTMYGADPYQYYFLISSDRFEAIVTPLKTALGESGFEMLEFNLSELGIEDINYLVDGIPVNEEMLTLGGMMAEKGMIKLTYNSGGRIHTAVCTCFTASNGDNEMAAYVQMPVANDMTAATGHLVIKAIVDGDDVTYTLQYVPAIPTVDLANFGFDAITPDGTVATKSFEDAADPAVFRQRFTNAINAFRSGKVRVLASTFTGTGTIPSVSYPTPVGNVDGGVWTFVMFVIMQFDQPLIQYSVKFYETSMTVQAQAKLVNIPAASLN